MMASAPTRVSGVKMRHFLSPTRNLAVYRDTLTPRARYIPILVTKICEEETYLGNKMELNLNKV
jgi:hypothetical protein